ncbi:MAG: hypothetical protein M3P48_12070 [Actinomycetota bacterium]|nr:hypothetical protein [Actinomycetota bacterium]
MRVLLFGAPRSVLCLVQGVLFAIVLVGTQAVLRNDVSRWTVLVGVAGGVVVGLVTGTSVHRRNERVAAAARQLPAGERVTAVRAAVRGPVPDERRVRAPAREVATALLGELHGERRGVLLLVPVAVLFVMLALGGQPRYWAALALVTALVVGSALEYRHLQRRVRLLRNPKTTR